MFCDFQASISFISAADWFTDGRLYFRSSDLDVTWSFNVTLSNILSILFCAICADFMFALVGSSNSTLPFSVTQISSLFHFFNSREYLKIAKTKLVTIDDWSRIQEEKLQRKKLKKKVRHSPNAASFCKNLKTFYRPQVAHNIDWRLIPPPKKKKSRKVFSD